MDTRVASSDEISRPKAFRILAVVFGLVFGLAFFGFPGLVLGWFETGERLVHRVHDLGGSVVTGILFAVGLFALAARRTVAALYQVAVTTVAGIVAAALATDPMWLVFVAPGVVAVATLLAVAGPGYRRAYFSPRLRPSAAMAALSVAAAVPLTSYALSMARLQRIGLPSDSHVEEHHWASMATMALALWMIGLLASVRMPGWLLPARCVGLGAMVFGLASVVFPNYPGSAGSTWGLVALAGGAAFIGAAEWEARRA